MLLESLRSLIERGDPWQRGDERHIAFGIGVCLLDPLGQNIGSDAARLHVVGRQHRGQGHGIGSGIDPDDLDFLSSFIDRPAERGKLRGRDHDRRRVRCYGTLEDADLAADVGL